MTCVSTSRSQGRSFSTNAATPGFWSPMELSMPEGVSAMRGVSLPAQPFSERPFVVIAPRRLTSKNCAYSFPEANVPDAVVTGFFMRSPPRETCIFTLIYHTTFAASKIGPSTHERLKPSVVATTHERHAPIPQAMRFSSDDSRRDILGARDIAERLHHGFRAATSNKIVGLRPGAVRLPHRCRNRDSHRCHHQLHNTARARATAV